MLKVSIIIPTYNRADLLSYTIESALQQDYPNIEVIISDNASTDNTSEMIKQYQDDERFKYFRNEKNLGMVPNQKKGLFDYATGDWAVVLDSDDFFIDNSYISKVMNLINKNNDIILVHANCRILNDNTGYYKDTNKQLPDVVDGKWMFINYKYPARGGLVNYDKLTVVFNRKIAMELNFFNDVILSSDRESFLKLSLKGKIGFINDVVAVYRVHGDNLSGTSDMNDFFENMRAVLNPYDYAKQLKSFELNHLEKWKRRMIRESSETALVNNLLATEKRVEFLKSFIRRLYLDYPFALTVVASILKPKILAKLILVSTVKRKKAKRVHD